MSTRTTNHVVAALPSASVAVVYLWPLFNPDSYLPGTDLNSLSGAMRIEWLVLAAGLFCLPLLVIPGRRRLPKACFFCLLTYSFAWGSYTLSGWYGLLQFVLLLMATYGGDSLFFRDETRRNVAGMVALIRFVVVVAVFFPLVVAFDLGGTGSIANWRGDTTVIQFGAAFFSMLLLLELTLFAWLRVHAGDKFSFVLQPERRAAAGPVQLNEVEERRRRFYQAISDGKHQG